jgi:uncharacterized protein
VRIFLDTNVLVSALSTRGLCADVLRIILAEHELVLSEHVRGELRRVLMGKIRMPEALVEDVLSLVDSADIAPTPDSHHLADLVRDPADQKVLAAAMAAGVDALVTGDAELLAVASSSKLAILGPRAFWARLSAPLD